jgi:hypothetical protein
MRTFGGTEAYKYWQSKESPEWLLLTSQSEMYGKRDVDRPELEFRTDTRANTDTAQAYARAFSSEPLLGIQNKFGPNFRGAVFIERLPKTQRNFFEILKKEAFYYSKTFWKPGGEFGHYHEEVLKQAEDAFGKHSVSYYRDARSIPTDDTTNMVVALAVAYTRDMSLINHLHRKNEITDAEKKFALDEINNRMDRIGLNGVDLLFESMPELSKFMEENDREFIPADSIGVSKEKYSTYYKREVKPREDKADGVLSSARSNLMGQGFSELQHEKNMFILTHVIDLPPLDDKKREEFMPYQKIVDDSPETSAYRTARSKFVVKLLSQGDPDRKDFYHFVNAIIQDGPAVNHPKRDTFAKDLRERIKQNTPDDVIDVEATLVKDRPPVAGMLEGPKDQPVKNEPEVIDVEILETRPTPSPSPAPTPEPIRIMLDGEGSGPADKSAGKTDKRQPEDVIDAEFEPAGGALPKDKADEKTDSDKDAAKTKNYDGFITVGKIGATAAIGAALVAGMKSSKSQSKSANSNSKPDSKSSGNGTFYTAVAALAAVAGIAIVWKTPLVETILKNISRSA